MIEESVLVQKKQRDITCKIQSSIFGDPWLDQLNEYLHNNLVFVRDYLKEYLFLVKMTVPKGTYFAWIDVAAYLHGAIRADVDSFLVKSADILIESDPTHPTANHRGLLPIRNHL